MGLKKKVRKVGKKAVKVGKKISKAAKIAVPVITAISSQPSQSEESGS